MRVLSYIFALFLVGFDATGFSHESVVTSSPANPVQFWPIDCQTFNQKEVCGINHRCWYQKWNCDDEIKLQFYDTLSDDTNFDPVTDFHDLSTFTNVTDDETPFGPQKDWVLSATPSVTQTGSNQISKYLRSPAYTFIPGRRYKFSVSVTGAVATQRPNVRVFANDMTIQAQSTGVSNLVAGATIIMTVIFTADTDTAYVGIQSFFGNVGLPTGAVMTVNSLITEIAIPDDIVIQVLDEQGSEIDQIELIPSIINGTYDSVAVYSGSFIPSDYNICDERISLKILNTTVSPDEEVLISDGLDIQTAHKCTNLIEFTSNRNYAGLFYDGLSPATTFNIRVESVFHDEELPQEDFMMELSTSVEKTGSVLTAQRLFKIRMAPDYFHKKLVAIFNHQFVLIDGSYWVKAEKLNKEEKSNPRQPMRSASVLLTQRDFLLRSTL